MIQTVRTHPIENINKFVVYFLFNKVLPMVKHLHFPGKATYPQDSLHLYRWEIIIVIFSNCSNHLMIFSSVRALQTSDAI